MADKRPDLQDLKNVVAGLPPATWAARLRAVMPLIERRIREEGLRVPEIVAALNEQAGGSGRKLTADNLRWAIFRYRQRMRAEGTDPKASATDDRGRAEGEQAEGTEGIRPATRDARTSERTTPPATQPSERREKPAREPAAEHRETATSKADLKRIRSQDVDLEALAKAARDDGEER